MVAFRVSDKMVTDAFEATAAVENDDGQLFRQGEVVIYPTHGVGTIDQIGVEEIAGHRLNLIYITFEENQMSLRIPVAKARQTGLRRLAAGPQLEKAIRLLKGRKRTGRGMWSKRAQEYTAKINSGDLISLCEVVKELWVEDLAIASFSQREFCERAMGRVAAEFAATKGISRQDALDQMSQMLAVKPEA